MFLYICFCCCCMGLVFLFFFSFFKFHLLCYSIRAETMVLQSLCSLAVKISWNKILVTTTSSQWISPAQLIKRPQQCHLSPKWNWVKFNPSHTSADSVNWRSLWRHRCRLTGPLSTRMIPRTSVPFAASLSLMLAPMVLTFWNTAWRRSLHLSVSSALSVHWSTPQSMALGFTSANILVLLCRAEGSQSQRRSHCWSATSVQPWWKGWTVCGNIWKFTIRSDRMSVSSVTRLFDWGISLRFTSGGMRSSKSCRGKQ